MNQDALQLDTSDITSDKKWRVLKFGGSSVSSLDDWNNISDIVSAHLAEGAKVFLVHSAFKDVTNQLEKIAQLAEVNQIKNELNNIIAEHQKMASELKLDGELLEPWFESLRKYVAQVTQSKALTPAMRANIVAHGELLSSSLGVAFLSKHFPNLKVLWQDAREHLIAYDDTPGNENETYLNAVCHPRINEELAEDLSAQADIVLSQGFIAANQKGETVLLGREGSDTSAAYFAAILEAQKLEIWTDVEGLYSCDPNKIGSAKKIEHISYNEAFDMAQAGAKVLHPRCLSAVRPYKIPIEIRSTHQPQVTGTLIDADYQQSKWVKAIAIKQNVPMLTLLLGRTGQQSETLQKVFSIISSFGLTSQLRASTKESLVLSIETSNSLYTETLLNELSAKLAEVCRSVLLSQSAIITLIGCQASQALWHLLQINAQLPEQWLLLSHTSSDHHLSFLINDPQAEEIIELLHTNLIQ